MSTSSPVDMWATLTPEQQKAALEQYADNRMLRAEADAQQALEQKATQTRVVKQPTKSSRGPRPMYSYRATRRNAYFGGRAATIWGRNDHTTWAQFQRVRPRTWRAAA